MRAQNRRRAWQGRERWSFPHMPNQVPTLFHLNLIPDATGERLTTMAKRQRCNTPGFGRSSTCIPWCVRPRPSIWLCYIVSEPRAIAQGRQCITDEFSHAYQTALRVKATRIQHLLRRGEKVDSDDEARRRQVFGGKRMGFLTCAIKFHGLRRPASTRHL